ncbi:MAG: DUF1552 domain-containing protein [Myxococcota bacterium]|jgi:hypothetical protein|nr:DUF1552 domain-containing protein [Myxococcota bacterium]
MTHKPDDLVVRRGRRRFLAGAAGLLALPFLESIARPSRAKAWTPAPGMPRRLVIFFNGHGLIMEEFVPRAGFVQGALLRPVADAGLASKTLVITGVNSKVQSGHPGAPSVLTCTPLEADQYGITHPRTASVDHVIARHMQDGGPARRFDVGVHDQSVDLGARSLSDDHTQMFWSGDDEHVPSIIHPHVALDRAFPSTTGEPTEPTVDARTIRRRSVLDGALAQLTRLQGRVSTSDRVRLERHAEHLRAIELSLGSTVTPPSPTCGDPAFDRSATTHARAAEVLIDTLALAMACNVADVGTFKAFDMEEGAWGHVVHPDLATTFGGENYHGAWHKASDQRLDYARRAFTAINAWHGSLFARLIRRLDEVDEGDGSALDHSLVMWISDFGHGGGHGSDNLPIVIAGNAGGAALGRHVNFARDPASPYGDASQPGNHNLCVSLLQAFGISGDRFGDYTNVSQPVEPGPLSL